MDYLKREFNGKDDLTHKPSNVGYVQGRCASSFTPINQSSSPLKTNSAFDAALRAAAEQSEAANAVRLPLQNPLLVEHLGLGSDVVAPALAELSPNARTSKLKSAGVPTSGIRRRRNNPPTPPKRYPIALQSNNEVAPERSTSFTTRPMKRIVRARNTIGQVFPASKSAKNIDFSTADESSKTRNLSIKNVAKPNLEIYTSNGEAKKLETNAFQGIRTIGNQDQRLFHQSGTKFDRFEVTTRETSPLEFGSDQNWCKKDVTDTWNVGTSAVCECEVSNASIDCGGATVDDALFDAFINYPPVSPDIEQSNLPTEEKVPVLKGNYRDILPRRTDLVVSDGVNSHPTIAETKRSTDDIEDQDFLALLSDSFEDGSTASQKGKSKELAAISTARDEASRIPPKSYRSVLESDEPWHEDEDSTADLSALLDTLTQPAQSNTSQKTHQTTPHQASSRKTHKLDLSVIAPTPKPSRPIARPSFPASTPSQSPISGLSAATLLRTCFRIGEAINSGCEALRRNADYIIELYARVVSSHRDSQSGRQHFVFRDLFHEHPPLLAGYCEIWQACGLWNDDCAVFLGEKSFDGVRGERMCRVVGRMARERGQLSLVVLNIWEAGWDDVEAVRGIVCA